MPKNYDRPKNPQSPSNPSEVRMKMLSIAKPWCLLLAIVPLVTFGCKTPTNGASTVRDSGDGAASTAAGDWAKYCSAGATLTDPVVPNYADADLLKAGRILSVVNPQSYYLYPDVLAKHATPLPEAAASQGVTKEAHDFLAYLCGEFRDHPEMLVAKLNWVFNLRYLNQAPAGDTYVSCAALNDPLLGNGTAPVAPYDPAGSPWQQMCVGDYDRYVTISAQLFNFRETRLKYEIQQGFTYEDGTKVTTPLKIGEAQVDRHVPGYTVCETKYIFADYVKRNKPFAMGNENGNAAYNRYMTGYQAFKAACTPGDLGYYYDFRGDSNFKPNSPESNGMIWFARTMSKNCETRAKAKQGAVVTDADCQRYYEAPFRSRYAAARAGLGTWLLHAAQYEKAMNDFKGTQFTVVQQQANNPADIFGDKGPYLFRIGDVFSGKKISAPGQPGAFLPGIETSWAESDMGLAKLSGLSGPQLGDMLYRRVNNAVDRHTDWYAAGFDNAPQLSNNDAKRMMNSQAYSPFVASSYEMSKSNGFTACGVTIPCNGNPDYDNHKHWMFIFKIKKENWVKPEDVMSGNLTLDFDRMWFDETSFGDSGLANDERAWDRLGSPTKDEYAEILYLYRIGNSGF
jgi:hypothetical protein